MFEYNPHLVLVTWGPFVFQTVSEDSIVVCTLDEDAVTKTTGAKGHAVATINGNRGGKARVMLIQGSPEAALISALCASNRPKQAPLVKYPFTVSELRGTSLALGPEAWLTKVPDLTRKKAQQSNEFVFDIAEWTTLINGGAIPV